MQNPNWFSAGIIYCRVGKKIEFVVIESKSTDSRYISFPPAIKFPGGMKEPSDENPLDTSIREVSQETGLRMLVPEFLYSETGTGNVSRFFFFCDINHCIGSLRTHSIIDGKDILSSPFWLGSKEIKDKIYRTHHRAYLQIMKIFNL